MMEDLRELYQEVILDHNKNPKNFYELESSSHTAEGYNPLCGDRINIYLKVEGDIIKDISFQGSGCAISKSSTSLMTTVLMGKTISEVKDLFKSFQNMITSNSDFDMDLETLGKLAVFSGVREYPVRVKCAGLAWHTMLAALEVNEKVVSTE